MLKLNITGIGTLSNATRLGCSVTDHNVLDYTSPDILWACHDTPIGPDDVPDTQRVMDWIRTDVRSVTPKTLILISSQLPIGSTARLEQEFPEYVFAYSPENIRVKTAFGDFMKQARIVVGIRGHRPGRLLEQLLSPFTDNIIFTDPETAEMVKHALNCYLGMSIAFINEIAKLCASEGADANVVSQALRTDSRVSPNAPLKPGPAFGGGHLARDIHTVTQIAAKRGISLPIISHIRESNGNIA